MARPCKCQICKVELPKEFDYVLEYTSTTGSSLKKHGHEVCVRRWYEEYCGEKEVRDTLEKVLNIPQIPKQFILQIRGIHTQYSYRIINRTILEKRDAIYNNFDKGWFYLAGIINGSIAQVYFADRKDSEVAKKMRKTTVAIEEFDHQENHGQYDNTDYSKIFD